MGKFTSYDAPLGVAGPISTRRATVDDFGGDAKGFQIAAKEIVSFTDLLEKNEIKKEKAYVNQTDIDTQALFSDKFNVSKENANENATDFSKNFLTEYDTHVATTLDAATSSRVKEALKLDFSKTRLRFAEKATVFEATTRGLNQKNVYLRNRDTSINILADNPTDEQFNSLADAARRELANTRLSETLQQELLDDSIKDLRYTQYASLIANAPNQDAIDVVLKSRNKKQLHDIGFLRLSKDAKTRSRELKTDARIEDQEKNERIRKANSAIRSATGRLTEGFDIPADEFKKVQTLISQAGDSETEESFAILRRLNTNMQKWKKLSPTALAEVSKGLETDLNIGGATLEEAARAKAAKSVLSATQQKFNKDAAELLLSLNDRIRLGEDITPDPNFKKLEEIISEVSPVLREKITNALISYRAGQVLPDLSVAEISALSESLEPEKLEEDAKTLEVIQKFGAKRQKEINKNYTDVMDKNGEIAPIDTDNLESSLRTRLNDIEAGSEKYEQTDLKFHTSEEIKLINKQIGGATSDEKLAFIQNYVTSLGPDATLPLNELIEVSPSLAYVGGGMTSNPAFALVGAQIFRGEERINQKGTSPLPSFTRKQIATRLQSVLRNEALPENHRKSIEDMAFAYLSAGLYQQEIGTTDIDEAVDKVLGKTARGGGIQEFNGVAFIAPPDVDVGDIEDVIAKNSNSLFELSVRGATPRNDNGVEISREDILNDSSLEIVGPNLYVVRLKSDGKIVEGEPGKAFTLHITPERLANIKPDLAAASETVDAFFLGN